MGRATQVRRLDPEGVAASPTFCAAVAVDGLVFLSGVLAHEEGRLVAPGDATAQARFCLDQIERVLEAAGGGLEDIVRVTCFATSPEAASAYIAVRSSRLTSRPAATTVMVSGLLVQGAMLEIEAIAHIPAR